MTTGRTDYLDLALPVEGELDGQWGDMVNNGITKYTDLAVAGTLVLSTDADVTLTRTLGDDSSDNIGSTTAQYAILRWTANGSVTRIITVPNVSKTYLVINDSAGTQSITVKVSGQTGVTFLKGTSGLVSWNGTDFVLIGVAGPALATDNAVARFDGATGRIIQNSAVTIADSTGDVTGGKYNKVTITAPATGSTLTIADGKTLTASNSLTLAGTDSTTMTFPPASASVGYLNAPINEQSADYTTVAADSGKTIFHPSTDANARTFTIAANGSVAYAVGTIIAFVNMSANNLSIAINTDTLYWAGSGATGTRTLAQYGMATALKLTSTTWLISGTNLT